MEFHNFQQDLKFVNQIGQTLNIDERTRLELALLKLTQHYQFDQLQFWGRIEGIDKDYYVALGLRFKGEFEFPKKQFFWCSSTNFLFAELPPYKADYAQKAELLRTQFSGQHERIVFKNDVEQQEVNLDDSLEIPAQLPAKPFSELERLSYVVHTVDHQCALLPVGAYKITPTQELFPNEAFKGLSVKELTNPRNYQHFRKPETQEKREFIARGDALFKHDFLDPLFDDVPKQQWSIQTDSTTQNVTLRNLIWPGFVAYHRANTNVFGYAYFGDGVRNSDFEFLI